MAAAAMTTTRNGALRQARTPPTRTPASRAKPENGRALRSARWWPPARCEQDHRGGLEQLPDTRGGNAVSAPAAAGRTAGTRTVPAARVAMPTTTSSGVLHRASMGCSPESSRFYSPGSRRAVAAVPAGEAYGRTGRAATGRPAGEERRGGQRRTAAPARGRQRRVIRAPRRSGTIRARITAGNIASRPNALVSCTTEPISAPMTAPPGQQISTPRPQGSPVGGPRFAREIVLGQGEDHALVVHHVRADQPPPAPARSPGAR